MQHPSPSPLLACSTLRAARERDARSKQFMLQRLHLAFLTGGVQASLRVRQLVASSSMASDTPLCVRYSADRISFHCADRDEVRRTSAQCSSVILHHRDSARHHPPSHMRQRIGPCSPCLSTHHPSCDIAHSPGDVEQVYPNLSLLVGPNTRPVSSTRSSRLFEC